MSFFRITLHRSAIGLPLRTRGVLAALGLRRRTQTVFKPVNPLFAGMIMKVKELVRVEEVERILTKDEVKRERKPDEGFYVESYEEYFWTGEALASGSCGMMLGIEGSQLHKWANLEGYGIWETRS
ncbi:hypothetical protein E4U27_004668 [Claviceps purpurea]|nr:hypothetical protein E4U27_004668 [Claviceps purpurea]